MAFSLEGFFFFFFLCEALQVARVSFFFFFSDGFCYDLMVAQLYGVLLLPKSYGCLRRCLAGLQISAKALCRSIF